MLSGRVMTGHRQAAAFTRIDWVREQLITKVGIDPYPGTLNLLLDTAADQATWAGLKATQGCPVIPPNSEWCRARCYPVRIGDRLPGAIIFPEVPDYPEPQVEVIAALPLRQMLSLADGDQLTLELPQPISVRAVIFDVDGTLVDSVEAYRVVAERAAAPYDIPITREVVCQALNTNHPTFWELVVPGDQPNQAEIIAALKKEAMRQWPDVLREYGGIFPGLRETLEELKRQSRRIAIVTGSHGGSLQPLKEAGLMGFFEAIITGGDVERRKPDPEGLLKCLDVLQVSPDETVYVGDTPTDVRASRAAGMASVAVLTGAGDSALLSAEGPDRIIYSQARLLEVLNLG